MSDEKTKVIPTDEEISRGATMFGIFWLLIRTVFSMFVGTAAILNLISEGPTWGNLPILILCAFFLLKR